MSNKRVIKIEPNPFRRSSVKITMEVMNVVGGQPSYTIDEKGTKQFHKKDKRPKNMSRLPNTNVQYTAAITRSGSLKTGLNELVDNPYKDVEVYRDGWELTFKGKDKVLLQDVLEYKHGKQKGFYTSQVSDIRSSYDSKDVPFYQTPQSRVSLPDGVLYLYIDDNEISEVNYYMLRAHNKVANSYAELSMNPEATHYIVDDNEKLERETKSVRKFNILGSRLEHLMDLPESVFITMGKALELYRAEMTKDTLYSVIDSYARTKDSSLADFNKMYDLYKDVATREKFQAYAETYDLTSNQIVTTRGNKLFWKQPISEGGKSEMWEWKSKEEFINNFLLDPRYEDEVNKMRIQLKDKERHN